nr:MAG TPA: hypothetical protein [Caudoviricetes sp.]DAI89734.1 MAG TPA: hypothetical protein [Caudoviricetes sp.]
MFSISFKVHPFSRSELFSSASRYCGVYLK